MSIRPDSPDWLRAKEAGDETEELVRRWLARNGGEVLRFVGAAKADLEVRWRIECKHDLQAPTTGNVAVEVEYDRRPAGIYDTHATHWVFHVGDELVLLETPVLRSLIEARAYPLRRAGDRKAASVRLVPLTVLKGAGRVLKTGNST